MSKEIKYNLDDNTKKLIEEYKKSISFSTLPESILINLRKQISEVNKVEEDFSNISEKILQKMSEVKYLKNSFAAYNVFDHSWFAGTLLICGGLPIMYLFYNLTLYMGISPFFVSIPMFVFIHFFNKFHKNITINKIIENTNSNELEIFKEREKLLVSRLKLFKDELEKEKKKEKKRISDLNDSQKNILQRVDKNNNGEIDGLEHSAFDLYLESNELKISKIKKYHVKDFIMISNHLTVYKKNIHSIFNEISETKNQEELHNYVDVLESNIESWQLIQANGIYMIDSLIKEKNVQFFRIYQNFEKIGIFDSTWQKNVSNQLELVNVNLNQLINVTQSMSDRIISAIGDLTYATKEQTEIISTNISSLNSSVKFGNLLSAINIHQNHRISKKLN